MKALIDADVLLYECSSVAEYPKDEPIKSFEFVREVFDGRIRDILAATGAEEYVLYITGEGNFREKVAVSKPYKGTRTEEKPFHYKNLKAFILAQPQAVLVCDMEADDAMSIAQIEGGRVEIQEEIWEDGMFYGMRGTGLYQDISPVNQTTVICTRDKDLRMVSGFHYGWECGKQPEYRMRFVDEMGEIELSKCRKKVIGTGLKFFYSQMLTGDKVDNIPGLDGWGPVAAVDHLIHCADEAQMFHQVRTAYVMAHPEEWEAYLMEQAYLLWMVRELDEEGKPVMWRMPDE